MVSDVFDDIEACVQMLPFFSSLFFPHFGVKVKRHKVSFLKPVLNWANVSSRT